MRFIKSRNDKTIKPRFGDRRIIRYFDDKLAKTHYSLQVYGGSPDFRVKYWCTKETGDKNWADRIAEHYGIEVKE